MKGIIGGVVGPKSCCLACSENPKCHGFSYKAGICYLKSCGLEGSRGDQKVRGVISAYKKK